MSFFNSIKLEFFIYDYQNRALGTPEAFDINTNNGLTGLSTAPQVTIKLFVCINLENILTIALTV